MPKIRTRHLISDHIICGEIELDDLLAKGLIQRFEYKDPRHELFDQIKHPGQIKFKGSWGPEILMFNRQQADPYIGPVGKIHCSYGRFAEIQQWMLTHLREIANA
jgi:hypothetical protein